MGGRLPGGRGRRNLWPRQQARASRVRTTGWHGGCVPPCSGRGGGTTRRPASDAFRLGIAVVLVTVSIPVMQANSAAELSVVHALNPPPAGISWLVTSVFWLGSVGVVVVLVVFGLFVPRLAAVRWTAVAAASLAGLDTGYPVTPLAGGSSCRSTDVTHRMPGCWPSAGSGPAATPLW